jgi:hypothetical protein
VPDTTQQDLTDLLTEGVNAVIDIEDGFAHDWRAETHGAAWRKEFAEKAATKPCPE